MFLKVRVKFPQNVSFFISTHQVGNYKVPCFDKICYVKIYFSATLKLDRHKTFIKKEIKFISFEASKKHVRVHSIFLFYFCLPFLKKVLYEMKEIC